MRSLKLESDLQFEQPIRKELMLALQWQIWVKSYQECLTGCLLVSNVERSTDVSTCHWQNGHNCSYIWFNFICGLKHDTTKVVFGPLFVVTARLPEEQPSWINHVEIRRSFLVSSLSASILCLAASKSLFFSQLYFTVTMNTSMNKVKKKKNKVQW